MQITVTVEVGALLAGAMALMNQAKEGKRKAARIEDNDLARLCYGQAREWERQAHILSAAAAIKV